MERESSPAEKNGNKISSEGETVEKPKFESFRINVKKTVKDSPIFDIDDDLKEAKARARRIPSLEPSEEVVKQDDVGVGGTVGEGKDNNSAQECDVLEVNAELDSCIEKDVEDSGKVTEEKPENDKVNKQHKKHKKNEKREKKKKRKKEKLGEETREKRHKKHRQKRRSRKDSQSRSSSSPGRHRNRSSSGHRESMRSESPGKSRDRKAVRSHDRNDRRSSRGSEWRYSPSRFDSRLRSRSRSPARRAGHNRVRRDSSTILDIIGKERLSRSRSPKAKTTPRKNNTRDKSPRSKSPGDKTPKDKVRKNKFPRDKTPRDKSRTDKLFKIETPRDKSPEGKLNEDIFRIDISPGNKSVDKSSEDNTPLKKSLEGGTPQRSPNAISPVENSSRSKSLPNEQDGSDRKMSDSGTWQSTAKSRINSSSDERSKHNVDQIPVLSDISPPKSPARSPQRSPRESPCNTVAGSSVPVGVVVPYVVEDMSISETDNTDGAAGKVESSATEDRGKEVYKDLSGPTEKSKKKVKGKKKAKKTNEEKKLKRKKKKVPETAVNVMDVGHISDDDLEDLLFTKTNKETKFEDVFHDTDVVTAKHAIRAAVVDVEPTPRVRDEDPKPSQVVSPVPSPDISAEVYEPDEPTQSPENVAPLQPPPIPPVIPGIFPTIPFLATAQTLPEKPNEVVTDTAGEPYSPLAHPILGSDYDSSPENRSTVHLSDISTKDSNVESTVGVVTRQEKIEDFLDRMPGSFPQHNESEAVDMDMSSPTNGLNSLIESDDDIIEQLHKEFVKTQEENVSKSNVEPFETSAIYEPGLSSPAQDTRGDFGVLAHDPEDIDGILGIVGMKSHKKKQKSKRHKHRHHNPFAKEKKDIEDALNRVHRQARVEGEMKDALKGYFKHKDITKEEYKTILRKAVPQVANSNRGIDSERIRSLIKKYVAKYKGQRLRNEHHTVDNSLTREAYSPELSQDLPITFSP